MNSNLTLLVVTGVLAVGGAGLNRAATPATVALRRFEPTLRIAYPESGGGPAVALAILGGFRALAADVLWLRMHAGWEHRNRPATEALIRAVTAMDPRPVYFWVNGARILAHDLASWRIDAAGGHRVVPVTLQARIREQQAAAAIGYLSRGMRYHPQSSALWLERASVELNGLGDVVAAARSYREAAERPGAPPYAARLHVRLLQRLGRTEEALAWLRQFSPPGPAGDDATAALAQVRQLQAELDGPQKSYPVPQ